eukprot:6467128-Amphidinium_carterae.2
MHRGAGRVAVLLGWFFTCGELGMPLFALKSFEYTCQILRCEDHLCWIAQPKVASMGRLDGAAGCALVARMES